MRTIRVFECDKCQKRFDTVYEAEKHEAKCYDLSYEDYSALKNAMNAVNRTKGKYMRYSSASNREHYEEALESLANLQKKLNRTNNQIPSHFRPVN